MSVQIVVRQDELSAVTLATGVHGAGYGLDVVEAFQSLVRGFERGLEENLIAGLEQIIFVEKHPRRFEILTEALEALPSTRIGPAQRRKPVALDSPPKQKAFVAMPFCEEFEDVYQFGIYQVVRNLGLVCERVDESVISGSIIDQIREGIQTAEFVVADLTGERPNVYLEVGYAWGLNKKVLLLARESTRLHFDLSHHKCIFYKTIGKLAVELERTIAKMINQVQ